MAKQPEEVILIDPEVAEARKRAEEVEKSKEHKEAVKEAEEYSQLPEKRALFGHTDAGFDVGLIDGDKPPRVSHYQGLEDIVGLVEELEGEGYTCYYTNYRDVQDTPIRKEKAKKSK